MDWTTITNQLVDLLLPILATFLTGLFTYIGTRLKKIYEEKVNNETAKIVVENAVRYVEQVYKDLHGKEKLEKAIEQVSQVLESKGITITDAEIYMLIESAVYGLNEGWLKDETVIVEPKEQIILDEPTEQVENTVKPSEATE